MTEAARRVLAENLVWYHTIELAPGVVTPGQVDLRRVAPRVLPDEMSGLRALDVGTFDGFWAFEMERRGAQVVALDAPSLESADWTPHARPRLERESRQLDVQLGRGFRLASEHLGSAVERVTANVYDLEPEDVGEPFDFAFIGALLLHLRDPVRALERVHDVLRGGGELRVMEPFSLRMLISSPRSPAARYRGGDTDMVWWLPNPAAIAAWIRTAGFTTPRRVAVVRSGGKRALRLWHTVHSADRPPAKGGG
ncbi:MAG: class I SAM-dependent methyltransferase [Solirubrobacterales bacterium]